MITKTTTTKNKKCASPNKWKQFNPKALNNLHLMLGITSGGTRLTPHAMVLGVILSSFYNNKNAQGAVYAAEGRLLPYFRDNLANLRNAGNELGDAGLWIPRTDRQGRLDEWKTKMTHYEPYLRSLNTNGPRVSMNGLRWAARYADVSVEARGLFLYLIAHMESVKAELGGSTYVPSGNNKARLVRHCFFTHPILTSNRPEDIATLRDATTPDEEWYEGNRSSHLTVRIEDVLSKLKMTPGEVIKVSRELERKGYIDFEQMEGRLHYRIARRTHEEVWELDGYPGGANLNKYEELFGFLPLAIEDGKPTLGYHWLYLISEQQGDGSLTPLIVGETTQSLQVRLNQHRSLGTNYRARQLFNAIAQDPNRTLVIESLGQFHTGIINQVEVDTIRRIEDETGYNLLNVIRTTHANAGTIQRDTTFNQWKGTQVQGYLIRRWNEEAVLDDRINEVINRLMWQRYSEDWMAYECDYGRVEGEATSGIYW